MVIGPCVAAKFVGGVAVLLLMIAGWSVKIELDLFTLVFFHLCRSCPGLLLSDESRWTGFKNSCFPPFPRPADG